MKLNDDAKANCNAYILQNVVNSGKSKPGIWGAIK